MKKDRIRIETKLFLKTVHKLLTDSVNFGTGLDCVSRVNQIEDVCRGFCEVIIREFED